MLPTGSPADATTPSQFRDAEANECTGGLLRSSGARKILISAWFPPPHRLAPCAPPQIDGGVQLTSNKKFLTVVPVVSVPRTRTPYLRALPACPRPCSDFCGAFRGAPPRTDRCRRAAPQALFLLSWQKGDHTTPLGLTNLVVRAEGSPRASVPPCFLGSPIARDKGVVVVVKCAVSLKGRVPKATLPAAGDDCARHSKAADHAQSAPVWHQQVLVANCPTRAPVEALSAWARIQQCAQLPRRRLAAVAAAVAATRGDGEGDGVLRLVARACRTTWRRRRGARVGSEHQEARQRCLLQKDGADREGRWRRSSAASAGAVRCRSAPTASCCCAWSGDVWMNEGCGPPPARPHAPLRATGEARRTWAIVRQQRRSTGGVGRYKGWGGLCRRRETSMTKGRKVDYSAGAPAAPQLAVNPRCGS